MPEWLFQIIGAAGMCASVYAAIRADLAALHVKADTANKSADEAHRRIDHIINHRRA